MWSRLRGRTLFWLELSATLITVIAVLIGAYQHFIADRDQRTIPGEGCRIVAFRQVSDRICEEGAQNMRRAFRAANSLDQLLEYLSRALGWDLHDLTTVTPPPRPEADFFREIEIRRTARRALRSLRSARSSGDSAQRRASEARIRAANVASPKSQGPSACLIAVAWCRRCN